MRSKCSKELKEFNAIYRELDEMYHKIALQIGLSDSALRIFYYIAEFGDGCLQKEIAEYYFISKKTIHSSIKNLESQGYLVLQKGKRRDMHVYLTQVGQEFVQEHIIPIFEFENDIFNAFSPKESRQLLQLIRKYVMVSRKKAQEKFQIYFD